MFNPIFKREVAMENRLKELREKKNLTQEELAEKANISRGTISAIENKTSIIVKTSTLKALSKALETPVEEIFLL
jgi:transcriptional regulator with XRE-family HTH domain